MFPVRKRCPFEFELSFCDFCFFCTEQERSKNPWFCYFWQVQKIARFWILTIPPLLAGLAHRFPEQVPEKTLSFYLRFPIFNTAIKTRFWKNSQKMPKMIFLNSFAGPFPEQDPVKTPSLYLILLLLKACGMLKNSF